MSGYPAGFKDEFSDDDFDYEERYEETKNVIYENKNGNYETNNEHKKEKPISGFASIFHEIGNKRNLQEENSLNSENIRISIAHGDIEYIEKALKNGFKTETLMQSGWTALMYAANNGADDIVKLLLQNKAYSNFQKDLFTPLMAVCSSLKKNEDNLLNCAKLLIEANAKVNAHDRHLMTPLIYAAKQGYSKLVKFLCENGADVNQQEARGWTALCFASANGFIHVVRVLLEKQADTHLTTFDGQKPADIAFSKGFSMLSDLLDKYNGTDTEQFNKLVETMPQNSTSSKYVKYGDLELFLFGLELAHLVPVFQEHQLSFNDLLKLTEEELTQMGITQLGVRKKLLTAIRDVHASEWDMSNLGLDKRSKLTMLETAAVVANITKHLSCIQSSTAYIRKYLREKKAELVKENPTLQKSLVDQCHEADRVCSTLRADIHTLQVDVQMMFPNASQQPADFIDKEKSLKYKRSATYVVAVIALLTCGTYAGYRFLR